MLDIDGHIAGLDEEIPDARFGVLDHQLPGSIVVLGAAVADAGQQAIDLIAQTAFRQSHIQHHPVGLLLLDRRQRGAQAVQFIQIDRKPDGVRAGGEFLHQQVVASALEQRAGQALQIALKDQPVVILHLARQREVQPDAPAHGAQGTRQRPQLGGCGPHPVVFAEGFGAGQRLFAAAAEGQQRTQRIGSGIVQPGGLCGGPQLVGVLLAQQVQQGGAGRFGHRQRIQQTEQIPHMAQLQHPGRAQLFQRSCRQPDCLLHLRFAHGSQHLQAHLRDLLEGVALHRGAVDVLVVVVFQRLAGGGLGRLGNGEGHVRLERQQPSVQVGEGDDLFRRQKAPVLLIQTVFLKAAHVVFAAARRLIQCPQRKGGPLLRLQIRQIKSHSGFPFLFPALCAAPSAPFALRNRS